MGKFMLSMLLLASPLYSCPKGQHEECVLPRPWKGCAKLVCVPNIKNPFTSFMEAVQQQADKLANAGKRTEQFQNREDCVVIVATGLAIWGTSHSGPYGGIATGAAGAAAARISCRRIFPVD